MHILRSEMTESNPQDFRSYLKKAFEERTLKNPRYSLRAFARDINISPQHLSRLLKGNLGISPGLATEVAEKIGLSKNERELFVALVSAQHSRTVDGRTKGQKAVSEIREKSIFADFSLFSDSDLMRWYIFPVYVLYSLQEARPSAEWVAARLGIPLATAQSAIDELFKEGLLVKSDDGKWLQSSKYFHLHAQQSTHQVRNVYSTMLAQANKSITDIPQNERSFAVGYLTIDESQFSQVTEAIKEFSLKAIQKAGEASGLNSRIYVLATQLFPIDRGE